MVPTIFDKLSPRHSQKSLPEWWGEAGCDVRAFRTVVGAKYVAAEGLFETPTHRWMGRSWRTGAISTAFFDRREVFCKL